MLWRVWSAESWDHSTFELEDGDINVSKGHLMTVM